MEIPKHRLNINRKGFLEWNEEAVRADHMRKAFVESATNRTAEETLFGYKGWDLINRDFAFIDKLIAFCAIITFVVFRTSNMLGAFILGAR